MPANVIMLGAAYQHGCLPIAAKAIERAIELNGTAVEANLDAFRWGRAAVADPDAVERALAAGEPAGDDPDPRALELLDRVVVHGELRRLLELRTSELIAYQDVACAERYLADVLRVAEIEHEQTGGGSAVAEAYARGLFKLMAYKDEYEVARLHLESAERARRETEFGGGARVRLLLHPPLLRALGLRRKLSFGPWVSPVLRAMYRARRLRGGRFDPFGRTRVRRTERELIEEYRSLVSASLEHLTPATSGQVEAIAELAEVVRGYEQVKLASVEDFRLQAKAMSETLAVMAARPPSAHAARDPQGEPAVQRGGVLR